MPDLRSFHRRTKAHKGKEDKMVFREFLIAGSVATLALGTVAYAQTNTARISEDIVAEITVEDASQFVERVSRTTRGDRDDCDDHDRYHDDDDDDYEVDDELEDDDEQEDDDSESDEEEA